MHEVAVSRNTEVLAGEPDDEQISGWLVFALNNLGCTQAEVSVRIVDESEIAALNNQYRQKQTATNVLSFGTGVSLEGYQFLGDIVIRSKVVKREAEQYDKTFTARYAHMLMHGLLHLLGYDHMEQVEQEKMELMESDLLANLGLGNPYE